MGYRRVDRVSSWRRFAMATWRAPNDPTVYGTAQFDVTRALARIRSIREKTGVKVTLATVIGQGLAKGLAAVPECNCKIIWGRPYQMDHVEIFYQVAIEGGRDLAGTTVSEPEKKSLVQVALDLSAGARKVRSGEDPQYRKTQTGLARLPVRVLGWLLRFLAFLVYNFGLDLSALGARKEPFGSAMVTNVGSFGIDTAFAPIIPFSRVPILCGVGEAFDGVVVRDGQIAIRKMITLTATLDHRLIDGYHAGRLIQVMRTYLEEMPEEATAEDLRDAKAAQDAAPKVADGPG
jgi:pyruvate/2-oxoglutarate dehydrogenase complex dihydrolipoamide acyltransferase (E2) component